MDQARASRKSTGSCTSVLARSLWAVRSRPTLSPMCELEDLHARWNRRVLALAVQILGDRDEAEEAAQDVFIEAWRRRPDYDAARGSEWAWLRMMTQSRCFDRLRATRRQARLAEEASAEPAPQEPLRADDGETSDVVALLARLPAAQANLIALAFVEGCTHREIAGRTGQPLGTVKTRIRLGLQRLAALVTVTPPFSAEGRRSG